MAIAYHIDRLGNLSENSTIELDKNSFQDACDENPFFNHLFSNGVSSHGYQYLDGYYPSKHDPSFFISTILEVELELMRAAYYKDNVSRLQAFFAVPTLDDVEKWVKIFNVQNYKVFEVEYDPSTANLRDANLIKFANGNEDGSYKPWLDFYYLNQYLQGNMTDDPSPELLIPLPVKIGRQIR